MWQRDRFADVSCGYDVSESFNICDEVEVICSHSRL